MDDLLKKIKEELEEVKASETNAVLSGTLTLEQYKFTCGFVVGLERSIELIETAYQKEIQRNYEDD
jgi:hypothetical protein